MRVSGARSAMLAYHQSRRIFLPLFSGYGAGAINRAIA